MASTALALGMSGCASPYVASWAVRDGQHANGYYALPRLMVSFNVTYGPKPEKSSDAADTGDTADTGGKSDPPAPTKPKAAKAKPAKKVANKTPKTTEAPTNVYTITMNDPVYVPDDDYRYMVKLRHTVWTDDQVKVDTDAKGLLTGVNASSTDESGNVPTKIVDLGAAVLKVAAAIQGAPGAPLAENVAKPSGCEGNKPKGPFSQDFAFDPSDPPQVARVQEALCKLGVDFRAWRLGKPQPVNQAAANSGLAGALQALAGDNQPAPAAGGAAGSQCGEAICFRPAIPYQVEISAPHLDGSGLIDKHDYLAIAPDRGTTLSIDVDRVAFNTAPVILVFSNGMLTSVSTNKPSEVIAGLQAPINALNDIASIPGQILTLKVNDATAAASLASQQDTLIKTQTQIITDLKALKDAQAAAAAPANK